MKCYQPFFMFMHVIENFVFIFVIVILHVTAQKQWSPKLVGYINQHCASRNAIQLPAQSTQEEMYTILQCVENINLGSQRIALRKVTSRLDWECSGRLK